MFTGSGTGFLDSLDIANRALQILGAEAISSPTEDSARNTEMKQAYTLLRPVELCKNVWTFATKKAGLRPLAEGSLVFSPYAWSSIRSYLAGDLAKDDNGAIWQAVIPSLGLDPNGSNEAWAPWFGTIHVTPWVDPAGSVVASYSSNELAYIPGAGPGGAQVYLSLKDSNVDTPGTTTSWAVDIIFYAGQKVTYSGVQWVSNIAYNIGHTPATGPDDWASSTFYISGQSVTGEDGFQYQAAANTQGTNPVGDATGTWTPLGVLTAWRATDRGASDDSWLPLLGAMKTLPLSYPLAGRDGIFRRNRRAFPLPVGFLRRAPQDPSAGVYSAWGAPTNAEASDFEFSDGFLVSSRLQPLLFRFVADVTTVRWFNPLFCQALAARLALETCERITQSTAKRAAAERAYFQAISDAAGQNSIEQGPEEPPMDDWLRVRY